MKSTLNRLEAAEKELNGRTVGQVAPADLPKISRAVELLFIPERGINKGLQGFSPKIKQFLPFWAKRLFLEIAVERTPHGALPRREQFSKIKFSAAIFKGN